MLLSLVSCGGFNKTYEMEGLTIDLPITYVDASSIIPAELKEEVDATAYFSPVDGVFISVAKDPAEEGADYDFSETELEEGSELIDVNGHTAMKMSADAEGFSIKGILMAIEEDGNVWIVSAYWLDDADGSKEEKVIEYLSTVEVE
jgi:hypothetical protein